MRLPISNPPLFLLERFSQSALLIKKGLFFNNEGGWPGAVLQNKENSRNLKIRVEEREKFFMRWSDGLMEKSDFV